MPVSIIVYPGTDNHIYGIMKYVATTPSESAYSSAVLVTRLTSTMLIY